MIAKLHYVFSIAMFLFVFSVSAQNSGWKKIENEKDSKKISSKFQLNSNKFQLFELNMPTLKQSLSKVVSRNSKNKSSETIINIPAFNGDLQSFKIYEASVFSPDLAEKYPNIKSYVGLATDNSGTRLRMSVSPQGVQTMITYIDKPMVFMQPVTKGSNEYVLYDRAVKTTSKKKFECRTIDALSERFDKSNTTAKTSVNEGGANDKTLQKFRIAISTTAEYTAYHNDGNPGNGDAVADALAAVNATLTRVNEVFETDMAVRFELVNAPQLIYTDPLTDPYSNSDVGADGTWSSELQSNLTSVITETAYDIGHLFGATGGGGSSGCIGCVCVDGSKGSGYTSPSNGIPETDTFDIDFVIHEIGHQMGANHTFAFETEGTGVNSEPGSGTTIMAYAGITGSNDVALNSDPYFHYQSIKQILDNLSFKTCQTNEAITNNPPLANAGLDYHIPAGTAYVLKGSATDLDSGDNLTYCWEQIDSGLTNFLNFGSDLVSGSTNRSLPPTSNSNRYIPKLNSVIAGKTIQSNPTLGSDWETVSTVARTLNWALTVRDRNPSNASGAQSSYDTMQITVENVTPFTLTNPVSWVQGTTQTVEWVVGQTNNATINCQNVNIKLSTDGGLTFPIIIASNTPNDGSHSFTVPSIPNTQNARILVEAADNIFYDVSDFNFLISPNPSFLIHGETLNPIVCGETTATFQFNFAAVNGFSENTVFSASGNPSGSSVTFTPSNLNTSGTVTMVVSNLASVPLGNYNITITGTSASFTKNKTVAFPFNNGQCSSIANTSFETSTTLVQFNTINRSSGKPSGYSNYTSTPTNVNRNSTYSLTVNVNTDGAYDTNTKVWIDWNQNCSFDDPGETYDLGDAFNVANGATGNSPLSVTIPVNATLGNTIMRVSTKYKDDVDDLPTSCENGFDGEVEDYKLNVLATLNVETFGFDNFNVFPNPNNGTFNIKLNGSLESHINIAVYDVRGRNIFKKMFDNVGDFNEEIQLNQAQSGMYVLKVSDGLRTSTKKIIVN